MKEIRQGIPGVDFSLCGRSLPPEVLLFFPSAVQRDDLLGVPSQGGPHHVGRIPGFPLVTAAVHPVVMLEMPDDRLDFDAPLLGFPTSSGGDPDAGSCPCGEWPGAGS